jgi:hypothetical protein
MAMGRQKSNDEGDKKRRNTKVGESVFIRHSRGLKTKVPNYPLSVHIVSTKTKAIGNGKVDPYIIFCTKQIHTQASRFQIQDGRSLKKVNHARQRLFYLMIQKDVAKAHRESLFV